jgi:hypothetical protein
MLDIDVHVFLNAPLYVNLERLARWCISHLHPSPHGHFTHIFNIRHIERIKWFSNTRQKFSLSVIDIVCQLNRVIMCEIITLKNMLITNFLS